MSLLNKEELVDWIAKNLRDEDGIYGTSILPAEEGGDDTVVAVEFHDGQEFFIVVQNA